MREADIRPADLLNEYLRLSDADVARFFPDAASFVSRPCPGCGGESKTPAFSKSVFQLVHCDSCATLFVDPAPPPGRLGEFYRDSASQRYWGDVFFPAVAEARRAKIFRPRVERIKALLAEQGRTPGTVTDVGAGTGIFLEECRAAGWSGPLMAVEPSANLAANCRGKGFKTFEGLSFEAAADPAWAGTADLVTAFEVIEHVPSVHDFVSDLAKLAKPGGMVLMTGLCGTGFDILTLGARSKAVSPPHHLNFLSRAGVEALLPACGLELAAFHTPGQLDLDIVANTLAEAGERATDPFLRHLLEDAPPEARAAFQSFLAANGLSSHLWIVARKP
jgi:SAM-dependent methyltransferase